MPARRYLFIGSSPRSGTSALTALLNAHPRVAIGMERYVRIWRKDVLTPEHFTPEVFLARHDFDQGRNLNQHFAVERFAERYAMADIVGDKFPFVADHLDYVFATFDPATVVYILRNPFSVCESAQARFDNPTDKGFNMDAAAVLVRWNRSLQQITAGIEAGRHIVLVSYERLFGNRDAMARLYRALDLDIAAADPKRIEALTTTATQLDDKPSPRNEQLRHHVALKADFALYRRLVQDHCILQKEV